MLFAVVSTYSNVWDPSRPMREQDLWDEHAAFMNGIADEGFVILGGTLGEELGEGAGALLIIDAEDERAARERLAADPWASSGMLRLDMIAPWTVLLGEPPRAQP